SRRSRSRAGVISVSSSIPRRRRRTPAAGRLRSPRASSAPGSLRRRSRSTTSRSRAPPARRAGRSPSGGTIACSTSAERRGYNAAGGLRTRHTASPPGRRVGSTPQWTATGSNSWYGRLGRRDRSSGLRRALELRELEDRDDQQHRADRDERVATSSQRE